MIESTQQQLVDEAITSRHSIRAFLTTPVAREDIESMLAVASRAPSGSNTQPWKAYVLTGQRLSALSDALVAAFLSPDQETRYTEEYRYYPDIWEPPYIERRRKVGLGLYKLLGLGKEDKVGMKQQHARNFKFFDAPVAMIFTVEKTMNQGSWLDFGCFLQNLMVAARGRGLDTCPQAALNRFHPLIRQHTGIPDTEIVMCCLALGYADHSRIENTLISEREPVSGFTTFLD
jgi:nitroreductase